MQFDDKLEGLEESLSSAVEQVEKAEPISAHPDNLKDQLAEGQTILEDLEQRLAALQAVKNTADELLVNSCMEDTAANGGWCGYGLYGAISCSLAHLLYFLSLSLCHSLYLSLSLSHSLSLCFSLLLTCSLSFLLSFYLSFYISLSLCHSLSISIHLSIILNICI